VLEAIEELMLGRTVITITHRPQALRGCDRVFTVENTTLTEQV
jgi:ABC-type multidrug transport system fused ATPase/permease subunit